MGTQQLLLIVLGVVLVGISIAVGISMFKDQAAATNRDEISNDLIQFAAQAQKYYRRPTTVGGGNNTFGGLTLSRVTSKPVNANATYSLSPDPVPPTASFITLSGEGKETGIDGINPIVLTATVWPDSVFIVADN